MKNKSSKSFNYRSNSTYYYFQMKDKQEGTNSPDLGTIQTNLHVSLLIQI